MSNKRTGLSVKTGLDFTMKWGTVLAVVFLFIFFSILMPDTFLRTSNIITVFRNVSITAIIAIGLTFPLTVGGFDMAVGSAATIADSMIMSLFVWYGMSTGMSLVIALLAASVVGLVNSLLIVKFKIPDSLATLAAMFIFEGVAMTYSGGGSISERMTRMNGQITTGLMPESFKYLGATPWIIILMVVVVAFAHFFLNYTKYGRYMYAVGGNQEAARLAGIPVGKYKALAYILSSLFAGLGGIVLCSRVGSFQINAGAAYLMPAIASSYVGLSVGGDGKASAIGTFVGAVLIGLLENGLVMMSVPYYSLNIMKGIVLSLALASTFIRGRH